MFEKLANKLSTFADHHQVAFALIVGFAAVCFTWGLEKLLEHYVGRHYAPLGYFLVLGGGLLLLWITKHFVLHII